MHFRRVLLAGSVAAMSTFAFADLIDFNNPVLSTVTPSIETQSDVDATVHKMDRLDHLTKTLAGGSYVEPTQIAEVETDKQLAVNTEKPIELNNETIARKYGTTTSSNLNVQVQGGTGAYSWLQQHPLPTARVSSKYGTRTMNGRAERHSGLDLAAPTGTPIYATGPGIVTKSGWGTGYGQYVEVNHGNGYITRYAHASRLLAKVGERVQAGDHIANVGCTGRCTGPHLHYEVVKDGQRKNPSTYLAMLP